MALTGRAIATRDGITGPNELTPVIGFCASPARREPTLLPTAPHVPPPRGTDAFPLAPALAGTLGTVTNHEQFRPPQQQPPSPSRQKTGMSAISVPDGTAEPITYINRSRNSNSSSALDPNHTHFVMVDDGTVGQFGAEVALRTDCEQLLRHDLGVPGVQLVVQGGPNTLNTVLDAISHGTPVVVVEETGGAADLISGFHRGWDAASGESSFSTAEYEEGVWDARRAEVAQICIAEASRGLLFPIKLTGAASEGIDAAIL